jgi:hypothetical protein
MISLDEMPLWFYLLMGFCDRFCSWFFLHDIPLPNWPRWFGKEEGNDEAFTPKEYFGDLGCLWDCYVLNRGVNRLYPKLVKNVSISLTEEQVANHPNHNDKIFWLREKQRNIEWEAEEAKREAARNNNQSGLSRPDAGGTGASS